MPTTYILECADGTYYTGSTTDLDRRFHEHAHTRQAARYTRGRRPLRIVYTEEHETLASARRREIVIKQLTRVQKQELIATKKSHE